MSLFGAPPALSPRAARAEFVSAQTESRMKHSRRTPQDIPSRAEEVAAPGHPQDRMTPCWGLLSPPELPEPQDSE